MNEIDNLRTEIQQLRDENCQLNLENIDLVRENANLQFKINRLNDDLAEESWQRRPGYSAF